MGLKQGSIATPHICPLIDLVLSVATVREDVEDWDMDAVTKVMERIRKYAGELRDFGVAMEAQYEESLKSYDKLERTVSALQDEVERYRKSLDEQSDDHDLAICSLEEMYKAKCREYDELEKDYDELRNEC